MQLASPLSAPLGEIHNTRVLDTYIAGEHVYSADAAAAK